MPVYTDAAQLSLTPEHAPSPGCIAPVPWHYGLRNLDLFAGDEGTISEELQILRRI